MERSWLPNPSGILMSVQLEVVLPIRAALLWFFLLDYTDVSKVHCTLTTEPPKGGNSGALNLWLGQDISPGAAALRFLLAL